MLPLAVTIDNSTFIAIVDDFIAVADAVFVKGYYIYMVSTTLYERSLEFYTL